MDSNSQVVVEQEPITQVPRRSGRICQEPQRYEFIATDEQDIMIIDHDEPASYQEPWRVLIRTNGGSHEIRSAINVR